MAKVERSEIGMDRQDNIQRIRHQFLRLAPFGVLLLACVLRLLNITGESLWRDEIDTVRFAFATLSEMVGNFGRDGFNGPLYHVLMRSWLSLGGVNDVNLRYFSVVCGVAEVALVYVLARHLFGSRVGLLGAWFAAISPALIWYSGEGKMYTLQPALLILALYALARAVDAAPVHTVREVGHHPTGASNARSHRFNVWWLVFIMAVSGGFYVHLLTPLFLAVGVVFFLAWWPTSRHHWRGGLIALALCTLPYVPLAVWQIPTFLQGASTGHTSYPLEVMLLAVLYIWSQGLSNQPPPGIPASLSSLAIALFAGVAMLGIISAALIADRQVQEMQEIRPVIRTRPLNSAAGVFFWMLGPVILVFIVSLRAPVFEPRYVLWSAPALYILVGLGLSWLAVRLRGATTALFVLLSVVSIWGMVAQIAYPIRPDIRGAAQLVAAEMEPADLFVFQIPYTRFGFEYYLPQFAPQLPVDPVPVADDGLRTIEGLRTRIADAPYTNNTATDSDVDAALQPQLASHRRIWLIESEAAMWDDRMLVRDWYDKHMHLALRMELHGVIVSRYEIAPKTSLYPPPGVAWLHSSAR